MSQQLDNALQSIANTLQCLAFLSIVSTLAAAGGFESLLPRAKLTLTGAVNGSPPCLLASGQSVNELQSDKSTTTTALLSSNPG